MMFLKPQGQIDLAHRAYFLGGVPPQSIVVAAAEGGQLSVLSSDLKRVRLLSLASKLRAISPHPSEQLLACVTGDPGSLVVQTVRGNRLLEIAAPPLDEDAPNWIEQGFVNCH